jgi:hypothetical protein
VALLVMLLVVARAPALVGDGDTATHVATGRWILAHGQLPHTDPFSWTCAGQPWIAWEWLAALVLALIERAAGAAGLAAFAALMAGGVLLLVARRARALGAAPGAAAMAALLSFAPLAPHLLARPHLFTLVLLLLWLGALESYLRNGRRGPLLALVPAAALWANLHAGFLLGLAALLGFAGWELLCRRWRRAGTLGAVLLAASLATLLNPYGANLHRHATGFTAGGGVRVVSEWAPPPLWAWDEITLIFWLTVAMAAAAVLRARQAPWPSRLWVLPLLVVSFTAYRHVPLLAVAAAPLAALAWPHPLAAGTSIAGAAPPRGWRWTGTRWMATLLLIPLVLVMLRWPRDLPGPSGALSYLAQHGLPEGHPFNDVRFGGYLELEPLRRPGGVQVPVFVDGRSDFFATVLGPRFAYRQRDAQLGRPAWKELFAEHRIGWAMVAAGEPLEAELLAAGWRRLFRDEQAAVLTAPASPPPSPSRSPASGRLP